MELVRDQAQVDFPEVLVQDQLADVINDFARNLASMGIDPESYLARTNKTIDDLKADLRPKPRPGLRPSWSSRPSPSVKESPSTWKN